MSVAAAEPVGAHGAHRMAEFAYRFEVVPVEGFFVDAEYQRPLTSLVREIAENYNPALVGTIIVSERKKKSPKLAIIDGQNRWAGATQAGELSIPALVYEGLNRKEEATIFALLQTKRRNLSTYQRFRAQLVAEDPDALAIQAIVTAEGFTLNASDQSNSLRAIAALESVYRRADGADAYGPGLLRETMQVIRAAWGTEDKDAASADLIRGIARFIEEQDPDTEKLIVRLSATTPIAVNANAAMLRAGRGAGSGSRSKAVGEAIMNEYLKRR